MSTMPVESSATGAARQRGAGPGWPWIVIPALFAIMGLAVWIYQLSKGLQITNMRDNVIWGLYIISFMFFVGLSAGGLIIASAGRLFHVDRFRPIVRLAVVEAAVTIFTAAILIIPDLGMPNRIYNLLVHAHWKSPMIWDITVIAIYLVLSLLYIWLYMRRDLADKGSWMALGTKDTSPEARARDYRLTYALAWVALPAAVLVHSITAWIFGLQISRGFWYSAIMPPLFICSALVSGLALVIIVALLIAALWPCGLRQRPRGLPRWAAGRVHRGRGLPRVQRGPGRKLPRRADRRGQSAVQRTLRTRLRPRGDRRAGDPVRAVGGRLSASAAGVRRDRVGAGADRHLRAPRQSHRHRPRGGADPPRAGHPLGDPGEDGSSFATSSVYFPTGTEILIVLGAVGLAALLFILAVRYLPLREKARSLRYQVPERGEPCALSTPRPATRRAGDVARGGVCRGGPRCTRS